jgi:hypothetical protein
MRASLTAQYTPADKIAVTQCKHMYHKACLQVSRVESLTRDS